MLTKAKQIILGIDPGYDRIGWAVGNKQPSGIKVIEFGCIKTSKNKPLFDRYHEIDDQLTKILEKLKPSQLAIESLFFFKNHKTALKVSEARGVIISCAMRKKLAIHEYTPLQIKQAVTGYGQADKRAVEKMVRMQLELPNKKIIDDTVDALAIFLTHAVTIRS